MTVSQNIPSHAAQFLDRYADAFERAVRVFGDAARAEEWLFENTPWLDGLRPVDELQSADGAKFVRILLGQIEYGVYS